MQGNELKQSVQDTIDQLISQPNEQNKQEKAG